MKVFLNMSRALTGWYPNDPLLRARYLQFFDYTPSVSQDIAEAHLKWAFQGPKALGNIPEEMFQAPKRGL